MLQFKKGVFAGLMTAALCLVTLSGCGGGGGAEDGGGSTNVSPQSAGSASLSWNAPVSRSDGSPISMAEIAGFTIYYGTDSGVYTEAVDVSDPLATSVTINNLPSDTYYMVVTVSDMNGIESGYSNMVTKIVN